jgi:hypothetical protein
VLTPLAPPASQPTMRALISEFLADQVRASPARSLPPAPSPLPRPTSKQGFFPASSIVFAPSSLCNSHLLSLVPARRCFPYPSIAIDCVEWMTGCHRREPVGGRAAKCCPKGRERYAGAR